MNSETNEERISKWKVWKFLVGLNPKKYKIKKYKEMVLIPNTSPTVTVIYYKVVLYEHIPKNKRYKQIDILNEWLIQ